VLCLTSSNLCQANKSGLAEDKHGGCIILDSPIATESVEQIQEEKTVVTALKVT